MWVKVLGKAVSIAFGAAISLMGVEVIVNAITKKD